MEKPISPIGVFDSGIGGISVLRRLIEIMPDRDYIYYGDSINAPYGVRDKENVKALTVSHVDNLLSMGCKALCIACNTATSAAVAELRSTHPNIPLVGIEPAIKPAATASLNPKVLVMATPMTIRETKFQSLLSRFENNATIYQLPCPGLMEFIESGILSGPKLESFLKQLLWDYIDIDLDAIVLGCTHYPFVSDTILSVINKPVTLYDGSLGTAKELKRRILLAENTSDDIKYDYNKKGKVTILNSDPRHVDLAERLLYL